jgi:CRISPR/Cas system CSM-associated protein Csm4 (group 5 of RAMP superfamily)
MAPCLLVKLKPVSPWRIGDDTGARDQTASIYHSDSLYAAICSAMNSLGMLADWLGQTAAASAESGVPAVRFTSCFPFSDQTLLIVPPRNLWPPPPSPRIHWESARFVPLSLVESLIADPDARVRDDAGWRLDPASECLLPSTGGARAAGPFRTVMRSSVAVDRLSGTASTPRLSACLEFAAGAGLWFLVVYRDSSARELWEPKVKSALKLLADTGLGGGRSRGWGRAEMPEFQDAVFPEVLLSPAASEAPDAAEPPAEAAPAETAYWLLSLFSPVESDGVDWSRGAYSIVDRHGRIESRVRYGDKKKPLRMVSEGSVLFAPDSPAGSAPDVAPDGFPHPVYRFGYAVSIPITWRLPA